MATASALRREVEDREFTFIADWIKNPNLQEVRAHVMDVYQKATSGGAHVYGCIEQFMFLQPRAFLVPFYKEALEAKKNSLAKGGRRTKWIEIGCAFGTDVRKLILDGWPGEDIVGLDVVPAYWELGLALFKDEEHPPCPAVFGNILNDSFLSPAGYKDFLSVHVPLNSSTQHLLNADTLKQCKKGIIIINTSRGPVIDEEALADALDSGHVRGAGLDVFEKEPQINPRLLSHPGVTVLPHIGSCTEETRNEMWELCIDNCIRVLRGQEPLTPVNRPSTSKL